MLLWFGLFIGMAGVRSLAGAATTFGLAHDSVWPIRVSTFIDYFLVVPGTLLWVELSIGRFRRFLLWLTASAGVAGLSSLAWEAGVLRCATCFSIVGCSFMNFPTKGCGCTWRIE